jgi:hypothetical protein
VPRERRRIRPRRALREHRRGARVHDLAVRRESLRRQCSDPLERGFLRDEVRVVGVLDERRHVAGEDLREVGRCALRVSREHLAVGVAQSRREELRVDAVDDDAVARSDRRPGGRRVLGERRDGRERDDRHKEESAAHAFESTPSGGVPRRVPSARREESPHFHGKLRPRPSYQS